MKLLAKFNLILLVIFGTGGFLISHFAYQFLVGNARREVLEEARLMMASAKAVRDYTSSDLSPLLLQNPQHRVKFIAETVPAFGATTTFKKLQAKYPQYSYKEATLNPTNPADQAASWEVEVINGLKHSPPGAPLIGERETGSGRELYMANAIKPEQSCLECHSVPAAAPKSMLNVYGTAHGFGWKKGTSWGADHLRSDVGPGGAADNAFHDLLIFLVLTLVITIVALDIGVYLFVIRPLKIVSETADRVSRGDMSASTLKVTGKDEIAMVTISFNRMQMSLTKAFRMLEE